MKVFGHPVHPLLVHFPTALLPTDLVLSLLAHLKEDAHFALAGFYCLLGGVLMGFMAILTGLMETVSIPKANKAAVGGALLHGFVNGSILFIFAAMAYKGWQSYPQLPLPGRGSLLIKGILVFALFVGNYLGANLIYRHHVGLTKQA